MIKRLQQLTLEALHGLELKDTKVEVTPSDDSHHGDYATNIAFLLARSLGKSPHEVATEIVRNLQKDLPSWLEKVEVAGAGFINFTLPKTALVEQLSAIEKQDDASAFRGQKIMLEFTDPNPFKEFHIGHLYSNIVGESLARLLESQGAEVRRVNYQGDVGLHVAKALYGLQKNLRENSLGLSQLEEKPLEERAKFLGASYALGATAFDEEEEAKAEIIEINKKVYDKHPEILELYTKGREWSLDYFETIYTRLGTQFVNLYFESDAGPKGSALVREYLEKGVFEQSQGAVIFPGEKYGLHNRVFINSLGLPTYEAKELGLAVTKYSDYAFDRSIMVTGNEINEYFKVLLKALSLIRPEIAAKTTHISHGMVRLPEGKMSSRTGNVLTGEWLLNTAVEKAREKMESGEMRVDSMAEVAEQVGVGAIKYALLKNGIGKDIAFSFAESISFEGNAGPYLQYTYARTQSLLRKAEKYDDFDHSPDVLEKEERELLRLLLQFDDVVAEAAERFSPNMVAGYLFELAQRFNLFYQKHQILKEEDSLRSFRLTVTRKVAETLKAGLYLLGIHAPEKM